jgi:hypothetical protein
MDKIELDKIKKKVATTENEENIEYDEYQKLLVEEASRATKDREQISRTSSRQNKANIIRSKDFLWQK